MKVPILRLSSALVKIFHFPHVIFQTTSQFFFKFCINLQCQERQLLCTFLGQILNTLNSRNQWKCKFFRLSSARVKIHQILVIFSPNFTSIFRVMGHNSSVLFQIKFYILLTKGSYESKNLVKLYMSSRKSKILHFDGLLLSKSCTVSAKKVRKSYLS